MARWLLAVLAVTVSVLLPVAAHAQEAKRKVIIDDEGFALMHLGELVYMGGSLYPQQQLANLSSAQFAREYANSPRREFNARFDPEAASIVSRSPWRKITVVPADPAMVTEAEDLYVDYNSQFGPEYGDMLTWRDGYQPVPGERKATVVRRIDAARLDTLMVRLMANSREAT